MLGFAVAQVEARLQILIEAIAEVGGHALAFARRVILIAIGVAVGEGEVVVEITQHLGGGDVAFLVAMAAGFIAQLQLGRGVAGVGDVVDGAAQSQ